MPVGSSRKHPIKWTLLFLLQASGAWNAPQVIYSINTNTFPDLNISNHGKFNTVTVDG